MIDINKEYEGMNFSDVIGLSVTSVLENWQGISLPRIVLFYGPYGCGKNLLAYLFANKLPSVQITVRNTVDNTAKGAEDMISQFSSPPLLPDAHQVCILNEFTDFRKDAQRKWKDVLQAPPARTYFFICTNEPEKIIPDIMDRFGFKVKVTLLNEIDAYTLTHKTCTKYGVELSKGKKRAIARGSNGRPRAIIKTIQAVADSSDSSDSFIKNMLDTYSGEGNEEAFMKLFFLLADLPTTGVRRSGHDVPTLIKLIDETGMEAEGIRYKFLHMVYNRYNPRAKELFMSLVPPLSIGGEKFDLLARFIKLLKL